MDVPARERWWHFYGFLNFERFQREVQDDAKRIAELDEKAWAGLQARLLALEALRRGNMDE
jgi:DNA primase